MAILKNYKTFGLRISGNEAAEVFIDFAVELKRTEINPMCSTHQIRVTSVGMLCPGDPHQRSTNAPKFQDRSQEEMEWQEQCAREAAWKLAKNILK